MKISLEWLGQFVPGERDPQSVADVLTNGGLNVDAIDTVGDDTVLEVEVTSNRGDCLSHVGVAREYAALANRKFSIAPLELGHAKSENHAATVQIQDPQLCPHYVATVVHGVKVGPSPAWLARRLTAVGLRPINNVVDVTNYVLFELGQPLHAFDFDLVGGKKIIVRQARACEKIKTLDGKMHELNPPMLVIADDSTAIAVAGVMGGEPTQVTEKTVNILLEAARFDPLSVRKTARALALRSDSSYRFERGVDPTLPAWAARRAAQLIVEIAGGTIAGEPIEAGESGYAPRRLSVRLTELERILGVSFPVDQVTQALQRLELQPHVTQPGTIEVKVPSHRLDLNIEADLIEEVVRVIGLDQIPVRPELSIRLTSPDPSAAVYDTIIHTLVGCGFYEAVTFSFVSDPLRDAFMSGKGDSRVSLRADSAVRKADATLRPSLLPGLLEAVRRNEMNGTPRARFFEIGSTFMAHRDGTPDERRRVGLVLPGGWHDMRGVVELLLAKLDADRGVTFAPALIPGYANGACAEVSWSGESIGLAGRIDKSVGQTLGLREDVMAAELDISALLSGARHVPQLRALPAYPAAERDLSLVVDEKLAYGAISDAIYALKTRDLEAIEYVTTYRGKPLDKDKKSVTVKLVFRSGAGTLTGEEVEASVARLSESLSKSLGSQLRR